MNGNITLCLRLIICSVSIIFYIQTFLKLFKYARVPFSNFYEQKVPDVI